MRKLFTFAISFAAAILLARYLLPEGCLLIAAAVFLVLLFPAVLLLRDLHRLGAVLLCLGFAFGFVYNYVYSAFFLRPYLELDGENRRITATVCDYPWEGQYGPVVYVKFQLEDAASDAKTMLYLREGAPDLVPGNTLTLTVQLRRADCFADEETDLYLSRGIFLIASQNANDLVFRTGDTDSWRYLPQRSAKMIRDRISMLYPSDATLLLHALITGDRTLLKRDDMLVGNLSRSGLSHVVAVSGMHVSFLVGMVQIFIRNRNLAALVCIPLLFFFMALVGWAPSVVRAGLMHMLLIIAPLVNREADTATSLSFALLVLFLFNPYSATSVGLQLSFAASAGIALLAGPISTHCFKWGRQHAILKKRPFSALWTFVVSTLACTAGASIFTLPLVAIYFGYVALLSLLANLLALWAVSMAFSGSIFSVLLSFLYMGTGKLLAWFVSWLCRWFLFVVNWVGEMSYAAVYLRSNWILLWFAASYCLLIVLLLRRKPFRPLIPACAVVLSLVSAVMFSGVETDHCPVTATAVDVGQGQSIVLTTPEHTFLVDCGGSYDSGAEVCAHLRSINRQSIDILMLTHFDADHVNGVSQLLRLMKVRTLAMPYIDVENFVYDEEVMSYCYAITKLAEERGIDILYVTEDLSVSLGSMRLQLYAPMGDADENERGICVLASVGNWDMLVTGDIGMAQERLLLRKGLPDIELLVVGHHGSKYSTGQTFLNALRPEEAVISVGYNTYGHPTQEVLDRLEAAGVSVFRTDEDGSVTRKGEPYGTEENRK